MNCHPAGPYLRTAIVFPFAAVLSAGFSALAPLANQTGALPFLTSPSSSRVQARMPSNRSDTSASPANAHGAKVSWRNGGSYAALFSCISATAQGVALRPVKSLKCAESLNQSGSKAMIRTRVKVRICEVRTYDRAYGSCNMFRRICSRTHRPIPAHVPQKV